MWNDNKLRTLKKLNKRIRPFCYTKIFVFLVLLATSRSAQADQTVSSSTNLVAEKTTHRWLLLCCGLAGDQSHQERLTDACKKIATHCGPVLGITPERSRMLVSDDAMSAAISDTGSNVSLCTQENIQRGVEWLANNAAEHDEVWIIFLGHAHLYGNRSQFNIAGRDIDQIGFAELCTQLKQDRQVFLFTMPVSGFWIKPLAKPNRVIITATEPSLEFTGTEMPYAVADVLAGAGEHQNLEDIDGDGAISVLDFYLAINLEIEGKFRGMERIQTEHAQLEDNGDGRGAEIQTPYLPVVSKEDKSVSKPSLPNPINSESLDGFASRHILLKGK
jgi:hypothetical protein